MQLSVFSALGPISKPTPPTAALTEFFHADTVASDHRKKKKKDLIIINKKKKICKIVDFAVPADHRIQLKECEKRDNNLDLTRELEKKNYGTWR